MSSPKQLNILDFSYNLPDEQIAKFPLANRDESKLLVYQNGHITDAVFNQLDAFLPSNSLVIFNNTRVVHARLLFNRQTGAQIEIFCIEPLHHLDYQQAFSNKEHSTWKCMVGNAKKWKEDVLEKQVETPVGNISLKASKKGISDELYVVEFTWNNETLSFAEVLHFAGILPLPPYLNRKTEMADEERYQTVYAKVEGSVAAPTAGLHFTPAVLKSLSQKEITFDEVTLHVGAGTFKPVKTEVLLNHQMHEETLFVELSTLKNISTCLIQKNKLVAVGTTSTRTLESLYWHGVKLILQHTENKVAIKQWDAYECDATNISAVDAISAIIKKMEEDAEQVLVGSTQIIIAPGYAFKMVDVLVTNFHQPENTLILLIAAFVGNDWRKIYDHALNNNYRFLSYGDSSLLFKNDTNVQV
ncbi:MAG: S-adenosylmethionine:tRNA ribosyltransferase-isomerase [Bacteroidia bacterium]